MSPLKGILASLLALNLVVLIAAEPFHWADNVCNVSQPVKKDVTYERPVRYEIKVQSMCGMLPCVKTRLETRMDQSIRTVIEHVLKPTCCPGYFETTDRRCSPVCREPCGPAGECVVPDGCLCKTPPRRTKPGFTGKTCRRFVCASEDRWGDSCQHDCEKECMDNMYCEAGAGKCVCMPGWHGDNCTMKCSLDADFLIPECNFMGQAPPTNEPEANLILKTETVLPDEQRAAALRLEPQDSQTWEASKYMIALLSVISLVLLAALLIVKKRYEFVRNELYYASAASVGSRSSGGSDQPQSDYSTSNYYSSGLSTSGSLPDAVPSKKLDKQTSFAAATRNILTGGILGQPATGTKILMFSPKTESHLIISQKQSKQNIYAEVLNKSDSRPDIANRSRAETPIMARKSGANDDYDHIYQVPKKQSPDTTLDMSTNSQDDSNIYEELKPRNSTN